MPETLLQTLPAFNAVMNSCAIACILIGLYFVRQKQIFLHKMFMMTAFVFSTLFLISYLTRHYFAGSTAFTGQGVWRIVYFSILISHTILAIVNLPLILTTIYLGFRNRLDRHRKIARITAPIWLYVSFTGVLIYFMLFQWFAP